MKVLDRTKVQPILQEWQRRWADRDGHPASLADITVNSIRLFLKHVEGDPVDAAIWMQQFVEYVLEDHSDERYEDELKRVVAELKAYQQMGPGAFGGGKRR